MQQTVPLFGGKIWTIVPLLIQCGPGQSAEYRNVSFYSAFVRNAVILVPCLIPSTKSEYNEALDIRNHILRP